MSIALNAPNINGYLDRMERFGRLMSVYGNTVMLLVFIGFFTGWLPSPLLRATERIADTLKTHDERVGNVIEARARTDQLLADALKVSGDQMRRQTNVLKLSVCASLRDADLRATCLKE